MSASTNQANLALVTSANQVFTGSAVNDVVLYTNSNQSVWIGGSSNATNALCVGSNMTTTSNLTLSNLIVKGTVTGFNSVSSNQTFSNVYSSNVTSSNITTNKLTSSGGDFVISGGNMSTWAIYPSTNNNFACGTTTSRWNQVNTTNMNISDYCSIGTTNQVCPLYIGNSTSQNQASGSYFGAGATGVYAFGAGNYNTSIYGAGWIVSGGGFAATSDQRIKTNIQSHSNTIYNLNPVTYNYIDTIASGSNIKYGFIAQEVQKEFPTSVHQMEQYIPNKYQIAPISNGSITLVNHNLAVGSSIRLVKESNETIETEIITVPDENTFSIDPSLINDGQVFVYGTKVNDLLSIETDQILSLSVNTIKGQKKEIDQLTSLLDQLHTQLTTLQAKFDIVEGKVNSHLV